MKKNLGVKTLLFPMPVLIIATYDENGNAGGMNAAWGGIHDTNQIGICIAPEHKTAENILRKKAFTTNSIIHSFRQLLKINNFLTKSLYLV